MRSKIGSGGDGINALDRLHVSGATLGLHVLGVGHPRELSYVEELGILGMLPAAKSRTNQHVRTGALRSDARRSSSATRTSTSL